MDNAPKMSRRIFLRTATFAGAGAAFAGGFVPLPELEAATSVPQAPGEAHSSTAPAKSLDEWIERIFKGEFFGERFGRLRWEAGGKSYSVLEQAKGDRQGQEIAQYDTATGERRLVVSSAELIPSGQKKALKIDDYEWSRDRTKLLIYTKSERVWRENTRGDYWVLDRATKNLRKLGGDAPPSTLMFAKFNPSGSAVAYVRANNIYVENVRTGKIKALTHDGSETTINGTSDWVYEEEFDVRDGFQWSPDGRHIAYWQFDSSPVKEFSMINDLGGGFREPITRIPYPKYGVYPKVWSYRIPSAGTANSNVRVGVVRARGGKTKWMRIRGDAEKSYLPRMAWAGDSNELLLQHMNRAQNTNDVYLADARTGDVRRIYRDQDQAWVDVNDDTRWLAKENGFLWQSERDGWRHVYVIAREGSGARLVTHGNFDVIEVLAVDPGEEWLYFMASPDNATERYLYRTRLNGSGTAERVTPEALAGMHRYEISPHCQWALHTASTFDTPPIAEIVELPEHRTARVLGTNQALREKIKVLIPSPVEFFQVEVEAGVKLDAWMIKPADFHPAKKYPLLIYVYGEPAAQTVLDGWQGPFALFHRAIANQGYLVASIDNRGTPAPKGRAWRKVIFGEVGVLSSIEQAAAVRAMARDRSYVDLDRVGVWGWSGGGTNTLNLMFRSPELYKVGISVAPVPDQRIYDTIYQERYMGLPQDNVAGYEKSSAINFAKGLQGKLLLMHGSGDDNVHFAGSELLVNRMIELGKSFDFMMFPNRTHGISEGHGTRLFLFKRLARHLTSQLPAGPAQVKMSFLFPPRRMARAG